MNREHWQIYHHYRGRHRRNREMKSYILIAGLALSCVVAAGIIAAVNLLWW